MVQTLADAAANLQSARALWLATTECCITQ